MRKASCVVENFCHEAVILKERSDRFSTFLSLVLQEYLLCADLLSDLSLFMFLVNVFTKRVVVLLLQASQVMAVDHSDADSFFAKPHHAAATNSCKGCMLKSLDLKHDSYVGWNLQSLTRGKCQKFVVIEHRVEVLGPLWVDIAIKYDPVASGRLTSNVVDDSSEDASEDTISPLCGCRIEFTI